MTDQNFGTVSGALASSHNSTPLSNALDSWATSSGKGLRRTTTEDKEVILRLEYMTPKELKVLVGVTWVITIGGLLALIWLFVAKPVQDNNYLLRTNTYLVLCTVDASLQLLGTMGTLGRFGFVVWKARRHGYVWRRRRWRMAAFYMAEVVVTGASTSLYLAGSAMMIADPCIYLRASLYILAMFHWMVWGLMVLIHIVQAGVLSPWRGPKYHDLKITWLSNLFYKLRCASTPKGDFHMVLDAPLWYHWPKAIPWVFMEAFTVATFLVTLIGSFPNEVINYLANQPRKVYVSVCRGGLDCPYASVGMKLVYVFTAFTGLLVVTYLIVMLVVHVRLKRESYVKFRTANVAFKLQLRSRLWVVLMIALCVVLLYYAGAQSGKCESLIFATIGMLPMEFTNGFFVLVMSWAHLPIFPRNDAVLQPQLREFDWLENGTGHVNGLQRPIEGQPTCEEKPNSGKYSVFCFETALKMLFWSNTVYDHQQVPSSTYSLDTAMQLYSLQVHRLIWDKDVDYKALVSWGNGVVVVAFRGTDSTKNVKADLQGWRSYHPPKRGNRLLLTRPLVHTGFLKLWQKRGLKESILDSLQAAVVCMRSTLDFKQPVRILLTGHSMGGALACLAAYDIHCMMQAHGPFTLSCYTFGCPRVGNHAFCHDMDDIIPDMWHVINDQDVVARSFKILTLYKRHGDRVIINALGDVIVRPSWLEIGMQKVLGAPSMKHHLLVSYQQSFRSILDAQFTSDKAFHGGRMATLSLLEQQHTTPLIVEMLNMERSTIKKYLLSSAARVHTCDSV